ncbi:hypothetical protein VNO78_24707 [Psophocarpus tetragonolobus]|uniref:Acyl-coenzyme A thioesterase 13 n=1 Tax=Psophocarpus tetragonolobus TaxID=3891 RepID=A0AAN9XET1_PSOTE
MEDGSVEEVRLRIKGLSDGTIGHEIETCSATAIRLLKAEKGFLLCDLIIQTSFLDQHGNWHASAIATLVDMIASFASYSINSTHQLTLDFSISYYSTAKLQEEVEIEAKVIGKKGDLTSVIVEVRKKQNRELVALGKLWMAVAKRNPINLASKL